MPGVEHHRRALERRLPDLESRLAGAERKARGEGEIGRAVVGRWAKRAEVAAAHARRVLAGFRREALLREARAAEPAARRARRYFTRDSPLLLRLKLIWELERALSRMDALLGEDDDHGVLPPPARRRETCQQETPPRGGSRDDEVKEAVVEALLGDGKDEEARVLLIAGPTKMTGKSSLEAAVCYDGRYDVVAWRLVAREIEAETVLRCAIAAAKIREREVLGLSVPEGAAGGGKRLLVMDGAWSDGERRCWEDGMMPRLRSCLGEHGSMVVVTTSRVGSGGVASATTTVFR